MSEGFHINIFIIQIRQCIYNFNHSNNRRELYFINLYTISYLVGTGGFSMTMYCEICGEELPPEEESEGICKNCKATRSKDYHSEENDDYDPGIT